MGTMTRNMATVLSMLAIMLIITMNAEPAEKKGMKSRKAAVTFKAQGYADLRLGDSLENIKKRYAAVMRPIDEAEKKHYIKDGRQFESIDLAMARGTEKEKLIKNTIIQINSLMIDFTDDKKLSGIAFSFKKKDSLQAENVAKEIFGEPKRTKTTNAWISDESCAFLIKKDDETILRISDKKQCRLLKEVLGIKR